MVKQRCLSKIYILNASLWNVSPYNDGVWIAWGSSGFGVSSSYVDFNFTIIGMDTETRFEFPANITASLYVEGFIIHALDLQKQVELTCKLFNENEPALAKSFNIRYYGKTGWNLVSTYRETDYGNGTYRIQSTAEAAGSTVEVSVRAIDWRKVCVQANTTCVRA